MAGLNSSGPRQELIQRLAGSIALSRAATDVPGRKSQMVQVRAPTEAASKPGGCRRPRTAAALLSPPRSPPARLPSLQTVGSKAMASTRWGDGSALWGYSIKPSAEPRRAEGPLGASFRASSLSGGGVPAAAPLAAGKGRLLT
eukprot:SAG11_NODE_3698_length_2273_cov_1.855106_2_plen_143_part_00